jgi:hypothetical protein
VYGKEREKGLLRVFGVHGGAVEVRARYDDKDLNADARFSFCSRAYREALIPNRNLLVTGSLRDLLSISGRHQYYDVADE